MELDDVNMDDSDVLKDVDMNYSLDGDELVNDSGLIVSTPTALIATQLMASLSLRFRYLSRP